jgi:hypothetical protein
MHRAVEHRLAVLVFAGLQERRVAGGFNEVDSASVGCEMESLGRAFSKLRKISSSLLLAC